MELLKLLSANEIVAQIISFLLVFTLLRIFVWKHFLKILDDRRDRIASELKVIRILSLTWRRQRLNMTPCS